MDTMSSYYNSNKSQQKTIYNNQKPLVRLWVNASKLDVDKFTWDDDYIKNRYGWNKAISREDKIIESLHIWGAIAYTGDIPPRLITHYDFDYSS
jgi:hypothetical protein